MRWRRHEDHADEWAGFTWEDGVIEDYYACPVLHPHTRVSLYRRMYP